MNTADWKEQLRKQAAAAPGQEAPRDAIAEAFAAQAYTAIENRAGMLMTDPYLLGFEIIERNEANNRLVGAFAFRAGDELLLAPVFFLNGTIKGQYLLYRKTKDRFCPNNKLQIKAILATAESPDQGNGVARGATRGAMLAFDTRALAAPQHKMASAEDSELIKDLWKSACAAAARDVQTRPLFKQFLADHPEFKEKAASLIEKDDDFATAVVVSGALNHEVHVKEATAEKLPLISLVQSLPNEHDKLASVQDSLFKRGYAIEDNRSPENLLEAIQQGSTKQTLRTSPHFGIDFALDPHGNPVKVLVAPVAGCGGDRYLVVLEGDQKGRYSSISTGRYSTQETYRSSYVFTDDKIGDGLGDLVGEAMEDVGTGTPTKGKKYLIYLKTIGKFFGGRRVEVESVETEGDIKRIGLRYDGFVTLRDDLEETTPDQAAYDYKRGSVFGKDAIWIQVDNKNEDPILLKGRELMDFAIRKHSRASMVVGKRASDLYARANGVTKTYDTPAQLAFKLASLGLGSEDAYDIADKAAAGEKVEFAIVPQLTKLAHAWYEREPDYQNDFVSTGVDSDFGIPIDDMSGIPQLYPLRRERQTQRPAHYLDAAVPLGSAAPMDHIPDEVLMQLTDPAAELSQMAATSGMDHLIDHGALGSLVKTFDAIGLVNTYLDDLEKGIDRLGRIVFLMLWKPADFAEKFGENDMPNLENTLVAAFEKHGDLVLELRQQSSNE